MRVISPAGPRAEVDHRGDERGGRLSDDEPAEVFEDLRRGAAALPRTGR
jgi:hypothetical protein